MEYESKVKTKIRNLAKSKCANHCGNNGCILEPDGQETCRYDREGSVGHIRCLYFEHCVLPADELLDREYWSELTGDRQNVENVTKCSCGERFIKRSNRHKYCDDCAKRKARDRNREHMRKQRS